jgi:glucose-1-phosphate adenylyltransferase
VLKGVISDKRTVFGKGCQVGVGDAVPSEELPSSLTGGSTVVGMDARIPAGARIGRNCVIHPEAGEKEITAPVPSGKSVRPAAAEGRP